MNWEQIITLFMALIIGNAALIIPLFLWNRAESNSDRREAANDRRDILNLIRGIQDEVKDFHGRLCSIEERYRERK